MLHRTKIGKLLFVLTLSLATVGSQSRLMAAPNSGTDERDPDQGVRLRARAQRVIKGIEAELRGDFRRQNGGNDDQGRRKDLHGELENINLPRGTEISFCLATSSGSIPLAAVKVGHNDDEQRSAEFELESQNGDSVPNVAAGDKLEARKGASSGKADCGAPLLISASFHRQ
jgi:hypothetical protein